MRPVGSQARAENDPNGPGRQHGCPPGHARPRNRACKTQKEHWESRKCHLASHSGSQKDVCDGFGGISPLLHLIYRLTSHDNVSSAQS